jgi:hypothetical protein
VSQQHANGEMPGHDAPPQGSHNANSQERPKQRPKPKQSFFDAFDHDGPASEREEQEQPVSSAARAPKGGHRKSVFREGYKEDPEKTMRDAASVLFRKLSDSSEAFVARE